MHLDQVKDFLRKMKINSDKIIMDTLFIVEGEYEKAILKRIFGKIFGYNVIAQKNRDTKYLEFRKYDNGSIKGKIAVFCTDESYVKSIDNQEHIDEVVQELVEKYDFDIRNSCVFYLFDRDPLSNTDCKGFKNLIDNLQNPYENENYSYGGLLLVSYPCVESYKITNFICNSDSLDCGKGSDLKTLYGTHPNIQDNKISPDTILYATTQMLNWYDEKNLELNYEELDYKISECFDVQEQIYNLSKKYSLLSGLSCAFIEMGIIEL